MLAYAVSLSNPLPPGQTVFLRTEGRMTNQIRSLAGGALEHFEQHWPATGVATLRVEIYRLPAGAQVLETTPVDLPRRQLADGRLELRAEKIIPPNGSITVRIRYRQPQ